MTCRTQAPHDMPAMLMPEAYIGGAAKLFDAQGQLVNDDVVEHIDGRQDQAPAE